MSVPRVILEAQKYREEVITQYCDDYYDEFDGEGEEEYSESSYSLDLTEEHSNVRSRSNYALLQLYNQKGYDVFKQTCINMKGNRWFSKDEYGFFKGECAEVYLYVTILEFINKFNLPWKAYLSLVIPHRSGVQGETTELDLVLVSDQMITVFEAKSYNGNKKIIGTCTISRSGGDKDIFQQNGLHCESLIKQVADYNINDQKGMKSVLFSFAQGSLTDDRDKVYKNLIPVVTEDNLLKYLTSLTKLQTKYWKPTIFEKIDELSNKLTMEDHMKHIYRNKK